MTTTPDTLIADAKNRVSLYAQRTDQLVAEMREFIYRGNSPFAVSSIDPFAIDIPAYSKPQKDNTPVPVYEKPAAKIPTAPKLLDVSSIDLPPTRELPTISTKGLFKQVAPSLTIADFNEVSPDVNVDRYISEMNGLIKPVFSEIHVPQMSAFSLSDSPELTIPTFYDVNAPVDINDPANYADKIEKSFSKMLPEMQGAIDDMTSAFVSKYAPEYNEWSNRVNKKVLDLMDGQVLPDEFEKAMFTRARSRAESEFLANENTIIGSSSKSGFIMPPGSVTSAINQSRTAAAKALADQSTDIYIERRKSEIQNMQFTLQLASSQIQGVRNLSISYAGVVASTMGAAIEYSKSVTDSLGRVFEHMLSKSQLSISIMGALNSQYEVKLKSALSQLDGYRLKLETEKAKKEIEHYQLDFIESEIKIQEAQISRYRAMIDTINTKTEIEKFKFEGYKTRAEIHKNNTQAQVASFDVYRASIEGDRAKLDAETTKLTIFERQLEADKTKMEIQARNIDSVVSANQAKISSMDAEIKAYQISADTALQSFTAAIEGKKMHQSIYGLEVSSSVNEYEASLKIPEIQIKTLIANKENDVKLALANAEMAVKRLELNQKASEAAVSAYENMAGAALGSLNTVVSSTISASA